MKVNIGKYPEPLIDVRQWERNYMWYRFNEPYPDEDKYQWFDKVADKCFDGLSWAVAPLNQWWAKKVPRKVKIKYHNYDTWGLDHTLALVIVPGLKQLKATNHGYGQVEAEDVPPNLEEPEAQWNWVMDEMIWAFEQVAEQFPEVDSFYSGEADYIWTPVNELGKDDPNGKLSEMKTGPNHTFSVDWEGQKAYYDRIKNGTRLFGKYYLSLWD